MNHEEQKYLPRLHLQIWDNDRLSPDAYIGKFKMLEQNHIIIITTLTQHLSIYFYQFVYDFRFFDFRLMEYASGYAITVAVYHV